MTEDEGGDCTERTSTVLLRYWGAFQRAAKLDAEDGMSGMLGGCPRSDQPCPPLASISTLSPEAGLGLAWPTSRHVVHVAES